MHHERRLCGLDETGDPFSPMGTASLDFSAFEKVPLGWIRRQPHVTAAKATPSRRPVPSKLAQALIVDTDAGAWWIEYRSQPFRGLFFRFVDESVVPSPFAASAGADP